MAVKMPVGDVKVGMLVEAVCGPWLSHPFWRGSFMVDDEATLAKILSSGVEHVMVCASTIPDDKAESGKNDRQTGQAAQVALDDLESCAKSSPEAARVSYKEELGRARKICAKAGVAMRSIFDDARMGRALDGEGARELASEIAESVERNPGALLSIARLKNKNDYTYMHSVAVCALMVALAEKLGMDPERRRVAGLAGLMHDIGKIAVPLAILDKPGALTDEEFAVMRGHPERGAEALASLGGLGAEVTDVCLRHHERMDGRGYPGGLMGDSISQMARMGAICDVYDAITSDRAYKRAWSPAESIKRMAQWSGAHFDPTIFQAFVKSVGIYPQGSLVRLDNGHLAVVDEPAAQSLLAPVVTVFYSVSAKARVARRQIDLSKSKVKIVGPESPAEWAFQDWDELSRPG